MPSIASLKLTIDALNDNGTFSDRDTITGKVTLVLVKETAIESLFIKAKGDADVHWTRKHNDRTQSYTANKRYFKLKDYLIPEQPKDTLLPQGIHHYRFSFHIPPGNYPSSFKGQNGKIVYKLEVRLARSWRMDRTVEQEINFVSKAFPNFPSLMSPQVRSTSKEMGLFSKGHAHMEVTVDRRAYAPGETMMVVAKINNSSSSEMTPKFSVIQDVVYRASGSTKHESNTILKVVDNCIKARTQKEVKCAIKLSMGLTHTIQNCEIISVEYQLKVYLDISFAFDPEIVFPLVICPPDLVSGFQRGAAAHTSPSRAYGGPSNSAFPPPTAPMGPYPAGAYGGPSNSDYAPAVSMGPYPVSPNSGGYGYPGAQRYSPAPVSPNYPPVNASPPSVYPAQPAHMSGVYNNPWSKQGSPYASPYGSPYSSSSMLHPPPAAPTFPPSPSAPEIQPPPPSAPSPTPQYDVSPTLPTYNLLPSAPMMNTDFLSQSEEAPPAYSLLFPSSATEQSNAK
uniref:arrestin domain-containing protein 3-like n=1 Tax=Semicossyphus pulcher TaxID=241346 RepID=UPI0037E8BC2B